MPAESVENAEVHSHLIRVQEEALESINKYVFQQPTETNLPHFSSWNENDRHLFL